MKGEFTMSQGLKKSVHHLFLWMLMGSLCCGPCTAFAASSSNVTDPVELPVNPDPIVQTVATISASFTKVSNVQAYACIYATSASTNATILSSVELQSRTSDEDEFTTELGPVYRRVYNSSYIEQEVSFPISSGKEYRIKVTITDTVAGVENSVTDYFDLSEGTSA